MSDDKRDMVSVEYSPTLGHRLRDAREEKGMSISEVATQLCLTKDVVSQLENDQWDKLGGRIYARGYFLSYVKLLQLAHDEMQALFDVEYKVVEPVSRLAQPRQQDTNKPLPWLMFSGLAVGVVIIWLAYQQWQREDFWQFERFTLPTIEEEAELDVIEPIFEPEILPVEPELSETTVLEQDERVSLEEESVEEQPEQVMTEESIASATADSAVAKLQIYFTDECWVEVRNGDMGLLISKVMKAGESLEYESEQPFSVTLGRAAAATVTYNEQAVDLASYTHREVAKLTLGVES